MAFSDNIPDVANQVASDIGAIDDSLAHLKDCLEAICTGYSDSSTASLEVNDVADATRVDDIKVNEDVSVTATATEINLLDGVTATTAELNILDGVTASAAEINITDGKTFIDEDDLSSDSAAGIASQQSIKAYIDNNQGACANNANGNPNISDTTFTIDSSITESTWETVGPTDSGADNIWTGLDTVPTGVAWVRIRVHSVATAGAASSQLYSEVHARKNGSSEAAATDNTISYIRDTTVAGGGAYVQDVCEATIPVDGAVIFDAYWVSSFSSLSIYCTLVGYGYNA
ncbi:MAG: hypothetical protein GY861_13065 [bacterium]|nr:hypothetical protein [bacterium]